MYYDVINSPIGELTVSTDGSAITGLHIEGDRYFAEIPQGWAKDAGQPLLRQAALELGQYFLGARKDFDLPLSSKGTSFQQEVWQCLQSVPFGTTATYGQIAEKIGKPQAVRAVGTAIGRNPICIMVSCHRVLGAGGGLGGFVAGLERKQALLLLESNS